MKINKLNKAPNICLFGAMPDTSNLGVSALCYSTLSSIARRVSDAKITVFDHGNGVRSATYNHDDITFEYTLCGAVNSRRFYRSNNLWNMRVCAWLGGLGNLGVQNVVRATAILDISQGDSFTDMYGRRRFAVVTLPKLIALQQQRPLILLPQTYGPFDSPRCQHIARRIVRKAAAAWARDERSFSSLRELLGNTFDPNRHHSGVDVAFTLPVIKPRRSLPEKIVFWLSSDRPRPTIGFNVSGLIFNNPDAAISRYGFRADYRKVVTRFIRRVLQQTNLNVLLIPHVLAAEGHYESDPDANRAVFEELVDIANDRLVVVPPDYDHSEMKWIISRCDWFCGTRMHSAIAGLSTGVPTAAIAYSLKTQGVFETCGQGDHVVDPRSLSTEDVVANLFSSFQRYKKTKDDLARHLPDVKRRAELQMDQIAATCLKPSIDSNSIKEY